MSGRSGAGVAVRRYTIEYAGAPVVRGRSTAHPHYRGEVAPRTEHTSYHAVAAAGGGPPRGRTDALSGAPT